MITFDAVAIVDLLVTSAGISCDSASERAVISRDHLGHCVEYMIGHVLR